MGRHGGAQSLPALIQEASSGNFTAFLHVGDFAYDLDSDGGVVNTLVSLTQYVVFRIVHFY